MECIASSEISHLYVANSILFRQVYLQLLALVHFLRHLDLAVSPLGASAVMTYCTVDIHNGAIWYCSCFVIYFCASYVLFSVFPSNSVTQDIVSPAAANVNNVQLVSVAPLASLELSNPS